MTAFPVFGSASQAGQMRRMLEGQGRRYLSNRLRRKNLDQGGSQDESTIQEEMINTRDSVFAACHRKRIWDIRSVKADSEDCEAMHSRLVL